MNRRDAIVEFIVFMAAWFALCGAIALGVLMLDRASDRERAAYIREHGSRIEVVQSKGADRLVRSCDDD